MLCIYSISIKKNILLGHFLPIFDTDIREKKAANYTIFSETILLLNNRLKI